MQVRSVKSPSNPLALDVALQLVVGGFGAGRERIDVEQLLHDTERAFGHLGFTNVMSWADPARDLSVSLMTSGKPFITLGQVRFVNVPRVIANRCSKLPPRSS